MKRYLIFLLVFLAFSEIPLADEQGVAGNQRPTPSEPVPDDSRFNFNLYVENDTKRLGGAGADSSYTNGIRLSFLYAERKMPRWMRAFPDLNRFFKDHPFNFGMGIGQQLYTPEDLTRTELIGNDRPYAGWLYLSPVLVVKSPDSIETYELDLGIVGPSALGEPTQRKFHQFIHVDEPLGWKNQLRDEFGIQISYQRKFEIWRLKYHQWKFFDSIPAYGWSVGNIYTGTQGGILSRFGYNIPTDYGPVRPSSSDGDAFIKTADPTPTEKARNWSVYSFVGIKASGILHNIFLDGNTFGDTHRVMRVPLVFEYEGGVFLQFKNIGLTWRQVTRTPEFYETFKPHSFGSATVSYGQRY